MKNELLHLVDELLDLADEIQQKAYVICQENIYLYSSGEYDTRVIVNDKDVAKYKREKYLKIATVDTQHLDVEKIKSVLQVRKDMLNLYSKKIDVSNIGTTLNMLRELYHDILIDFERSIVKQIN